jgi:DNA-binding IclR family transcriptional regulator
MSSRNIWRFPILYILKQDPLIPLAIKITFSVGKRLPTCSTALEEALLCDCTIQESKTMYPQRLSLLTTHKITDVEILYQQFQKIKIESSTSESEEAVNITDTHQYALSVNTPIFRETNKKIAKKTLKSHLFPI